MVAGRLLPGPTDCRAWEELGAKAVDVKTVAIAGGGHPCTGRVTSYRRCNGEELSDGKQAHNKSRRQVRARVEHGFARIKT